MPGTRAEDAIEIPEARADTDRRAHRPLLLCGASLASADDVLRYPRAPVGKEYRQTYALAQLQLALGEAGSPLRLLPARIVIRLACGAAAQGAVVSRDDLRALPRVVVD